MRRQLVSLLTLATGLALCGCVNTVARREAVLARWVGRPEIELVRMLGAPNRAYETNGTKVLTYEERRVDILPGVPFYDGFGPYYGPFWGVGGLPPEAVNLVCFTNFTVSGGIVRGFTLRGNAC